MPFREKLSRALGRRPSTSTTSTTSTPSDPTNALTPTTTTTSSSSKKSRKERNAELKAAKAIYQPGEALPAKYRAPAAKEHTELLGAYRWGGVAEGGDWGGGAQGGMLQGRRRSGVSQVSPRGSTVVRRGDLVDVVVEEGGGGGEESVLSAGQRDEQLGIGLRDTEIGEGEERLEGRGEGGLGEGGKDGPAEGEISMLVPRLVVQQPVWAGDVQVA